MPTGSKANLIGEEVNKALAEHHDKGTVKAAVVKHLTDERLDKNKALCLTCLAKVKEVRAELSKLDKGGTKSYDLAGKVIGTSYTKQDVETFKKTKEKMDKLEKALAEAFDKGDYKKMEECCKST